jgi:hypothetical protein
MAAGLPDVGSLSGVPPVTESSLNLMGETLPVNELNKMYDGYPAFEGWFNQNADKLSWLSVAFPGEFKSVTKAREDYSANLLKLTVVAMGITLNPSDGQLKAEWKTVTGQLAKSSSDLIKRAADASQKMKTMQSQPPVGSLPDNPASKIFDTKMLVYFGAGSGCLLILIIVIIIIRRRRRKSTVYTNQIISAPPLPYSPAPPVDTSHLASLPSSLPPVAQSAPPPLPTSDIQPPTSPKFCPQCGAPFKPGARFCSKCGFKSS